MVKQVGHDTYHPPASSVEIKDEWSFTSTSHVLHDFTCNLYLASQENM